MFMQAHAIRRRRTLVAAFPVLAAMAVAGVVSISAMASGQESNPDLRPPDFGVEQDSPDPTPGLPRPEIEFPVIDPELAGWSDAGVEPGQTGEQIRANWVMISSTGALHGTVLGESPDPSGMRVFALRNGFVTNETRTDDRGNFVLEGLTAGLYSIVGYSPDAIFGYGINAVEFREDSRNIPRRISTRAITAEVNKTRVAQLIGEYSPGVRFRLYGKYSIGEDDLLLAAWFGHAGLAQHDFPARAASSIQSRLVALDPFGQFRGRVHQIHNLDGRPVPVLRTKMLLLDNGAVIAEAGCDRFGVFSFSGIAPGQYGLVAVGDDGFAAIGIRVTEKRDLESIPARDALNSRPSVHQLVSVEGPDWKPVPPGAESATDPVDLTLVQPESIGWLNHFVTQEQFEENVARPRPAPPLPCPGCYPGPPWQ